MRIVVTGLMLISAPAMAQLSATPVGPTLNLPAAVSLKDTLTVSTGPSNGFYRDLPGAPPTVVRLGDRVTIGLTNSIPLTSNPPVTQQTWAGKYRMGWMERDATLSVYSSGGGNAVAAAARTSDRKLNGVSAFGYVAFTVADTPNSVAEGAYYEARNYSTSSSAYGLEIDSVNSAGPSPGTNPYFVNPSGGSYGITLGAGGDQLNTDPIWPSTYAIGIGPNRTTWNHGLVFASNALTGDDGVTGTAVAIDLGKGHQVQWTFDSSDTPSGYIRSDATAAGSGLVFNNSGLSLLGPAGSTNVAFPNAGGMTVNGTVTAVAVNGVTMNVNTANVYGNATVTGNASIAGISLGSATATGYPTIDIDGANGTQRQVTLSNAGNLRWAFGAQGAEAGGNSGSDIFFSAFGDTGTGLGNDLTISRASGQVSTPHGLATSTLTISTAHTPASSTEACTAGQHTWDANYLYVCVATNSWKRSPLTAW